MSPRSRRELGEDCIDIWYCPLDGLTGSSHLLAALDDAEIARYNAFSSRNAAAQYLGGRILTRVALSTYADVAERAWRFAANAHGRPSVAEPAAHRGLHFNLSHTTGVAVLAVGRMAEIGIDIETVDRQVDVEGIGRCVFTAEEIGWVSSGRGEAAVHRFFELWTLKEAYMKARGLGFSLDPQSFGLASADGRLGLSCAPACEPEPSRWQFFLSNPNPLTKISLAIASRNHVQIRQLAYAPINGYVSGLTDQGWAQSLGDDRRNTPDRNAAADAGAGWQLAHADAGSGRPLLEHRRVHRDPRAIG
ncbi:MAG: 4'-phosphopantetheinyl transferase superfamily protein [Hyphomicrobiaceae bacterium]